MAPAIHGALLLLFISMTWQETLASQLFWRVDNNEGCLSDGEKSFCAQNVRISRAEQNSVDLEVSDADGVVLLYLSFRYLNADEISQYANPDDPLELLTTTEIGSLTIRSYKAQLGDGPDSAAGVVVITEPTVFEMGIVGAGDKARNEFVHSFAAAWNK